MDSMPIQLEIVWDQINVIRVFMLTIGQPNVLVLVLQEHLVILIQNIVLQYALRIGMVKVHYVFKIAQ